MDKSAAISFCSCFFGVIGFFGVEIVDVYGFNNFYDVEIRYDYYFFNHIV